MKRPMAKASAIIPPIIENNIPIFALSTSTPAAIGDSTETPG